MNQQWDSCSLVENASRSERRSEKSGAPLLQYVFNAGYSLIELMIAMAIGSFLVIGILSVYTGTSQSYADQSNIAQLNDKQRFAVTVLTSIIQLAGYYVTPNAQTIASALPASPPYGVAQRISGIDGAGAAVPDTIRMRFQTASGDDIINCQGGVNVTGANHVYDNVFSVSATNNLQCAVGIDGVMGAQQPLVDGVRNMKILYGIDGNNYGLTQPIYTTVTQYVTAGAVADWSTVRSVKIVLTFINPLANQSGQPATVQLTKIIQVL